MADIRFGVQTYSWQMSYEKYRGRIAHMADVGARAGFSGMEAEVCMLDTLFSNALSVRDMLREKDLNFAALALPLNWLGPKETPEERIWADRAIAFVREMGGDCNLVLCHLPQADRCELTQRQNNQIACITEVARRAADAGIIVGFHPNSSPNSAFRTREDYAILLDGIARSPLGFVLDVGHIAHGGMDPLEIIRQYRQKIVHVHFKDMAPEGVWQSMGQGCIDFCGIVSFLRDSGYRGRIMVEEESAQAGINPDGVTLANGRYIQALKASMLLT